MLFSNERIKKTALSLVLIFLALLLFLRHRHVEESGSLRWFDRPVVFVMNPAVRAVRFVKEVFGGGFDRYFFLVGVEKENEALKIENDRLKAQSVALSDLEAENSRLTELLDLRGRFSGRGIAARVTAYPPMSPYRILTLDKGSDDGVKRRAAVVAANGLVGQISRVFPTSSQVLLIIDPTSAVDGRLETTGARGLVVGKALKLGLKRDLYVSAFDYLSQSTAVEEGAKVVTSGMDGVYPAGVAIGTVHAQSKKKKYDIFQQAEVIPSVDFFKLSEVLVLP